jgi:hypothetical protein
MAPPPRPLLDRIRAQDSSPEGARPIVTLEEFFEGNDDLGSIGCNLIDHPGIDRFYAVLRAVRARPNVQDVLIGITEDMGDEEWPFSDSVYVLTSAPAPEVQQWVADLQPDEIGAPGYFPPPPATAPVPRPGFVVWTLWWD